MTDPPPVSVADVVHVLLPAGPRTIDRAGERADADRSRRPHRPRDAVGPPSPAADAQAVSARQNARSKTAAAVPASTRAFDRTRGRAPKAPSRTRTRAHT